MFEVVDTLVIKLFFIFFKLVKYRRKQFPMQNNNFYINVKLY